MERLWMANQSQGCTSVGRLAAITSVSGVGLVSYDYQSECDVVLLNHYISSFSFVAIAAIDDGLAYET